MAILLCRKNAAIRYESGPLTVINKFLLSLFMLCQCWSLADEPRVCGYADFCSGKYACTIPLIPLYHPRDLFNDVYSRIDLHLTQILSVFRSDYMEYVKEGQYVALSRTFDPGNMKIVAALQENIIHYGKLHFNTKPLIGCRFGSVFMIKGQDMVEIDDFEDYDSELSTTVSGNMINFDEKSKFSKEKMIKKKKKTNHANILTVMKPNLLMINEMMFARDKVGGLRPDLLAMVLSSSNVQNGTKCLLLDHNLGLVTGAIASRILPDGICIQLVQDNEMTSTTRRTLDMLNIDSAQYQDKLLAVTIKDLYKIYQGRTDFDEEVQVFNDRSKILHSRLVTHFRRDEINSGDQKIKDEDDKAQEESLLKKDLNRENRNHERLMATNYLQPNLLDCIVIIAQNDHPLPILKLCFKFLAPSGQFVIYSDIIDPLLECHQYLKSNSLAVSLTLTEPWLRKYQVLPDRSRPEMNTTGYGGYLLFGTKKFLVADGNVNSIPSNSDVISI